jgi:hypothetical protein
MPDNIAECRGRMYKIVQDTMGISRSNASRTYAEYLGHSKNKEKYPKKYPNIYCCDYFKWSFDNWCPKNTMADELFQQALNLELILEVE